MFPTRKRDCLSRIARYELIRDAEQFTIEVIINLVGGGDHRCEALLYHQGDLCNDPICGQGDSDIASVRDLLRKIRDFSAEDLFALFSQP